MKLELICFQKQYVLFCDCGYVAVTTLRKSFQTTLLKCQQEISLKTLKILNINQHLHFVTEPNICSTKVIQIPVNCVLDCRKSEVKCAHIRITLSFSDSKGILLRPDFFYRIQGAFKTWASQDICSPVGISQVNQFKSHACRVKVVWKTHTQQSSCKHTSVLTSSNQSKAVQGAGPPRKVKSAYLKQVKRTQTNVSQTSKIINITFSFKKMFYL